MDGWNLCIIQRFSRRSGVLINRTVETNSVLFYTRMKLNNLDFPYIWHHQYSNHLNMDSNSNNNHRNINTITKSTFTHQNDTKEDNWNTIKTNNNHFPNKNSSIINFSYIQSSEAKSY